VLQGAKATVFGGVDYVSYASIQHGESVKVIFPASGTVIAPRPMMILKTTRVPDQARAFIDYVLSEDGQKAVARAWLMPARQDIPAARPIFKDLKLLEPGADAAPASREKTLATFAGIFAQH
jgi:iron(III) transport system substrate-binding protein